MLRALGLFSLALFSLCGIAFTWTAFTWEDRIAQDTSPAQKQSIATFKPRHYGPTFNEANYRVPGRFEHKSAALLEKNAPNSFIPQALQALYLADYSNKENAKEAWGYYKTHLPILHFFQPFFISDTQYGPPQSVSLMALPRHLDFPAETVAEIMNHTCQSMQARAHTCMPVKFALNIDGLKTTMDAVPALSAGELHAPYNPQHYQAPYGNPTPQPIPLASGLDTIMPSSGFAPNGFQENIFANTPQSAFENMQANPADDTVAGAAMRAAYDMVRNRYADAIYQAQLNDGSTDLSSEDALSFTQSAVTSAAERAFEKFIQDSFGKRDFEGQDYASVRGYFVTAFKNAAAASVKSVGRRLVNDVTSGGGFKSLAIRSELLSELDENIATAFIDTGLAAAKNSQYAFLRNLEVSYKIRENSKPEYSLLTVQPLFSSAGRKHNLFAQAAYSHQGSRNNFSGGLGYRFMPESEDYVVGSNVFVDYQRPYNHVRSSAGLDFQTSLWGASANYYKGLTDWKDSRTGFQEKAQDGLDLELAGRLPFLPGLEVSGRAYRWQGLENEEDTQGKEFRVEYTPVPAFTLEGLFNDEEGRESEYGLGLRYNYTFGAPSDYLYDWNEQFRQKSAAEYLFRKARRENTMRVQERVDPDAANDGPPPVGPALIVSSPLDDATGQSVGVNPTLQFSEDVVAGTGSIIFTDTTDGSGDFTIPVGDARISIVNDTVTIDLSAQLLEFNTDYEITVAQGVFENASGTASDEIASGDANFTTVVDPTAGFPGATSTLPAGGGSGGAFTPRNVVGTWQTTINVTGALDGVLFESGATGRGIGASFGGGNLVFAAGAGSTTATGGGSIFGSTPATNFSTGLNHVVFVAQPLAAAEIGVYINGIRVINESTAAAMQSNEWAGTDNAGFGATGSSLRSGLDTSALTGATLPSTLSFWSGQQPADF